MPLMHIIYVSSATVKLDDAGLDAILKSANIRNLEQGLTGMLLYADGNFIQLIEGRERNVNEAFSRIEKDTRHHNIFVIDRSVISARSFDAWAMCFRRISEADIAQHPGYERFFHNNFKHLKTHANAGQALELLLNFADTNQLL